MSREHRFNAGERLGPYLIRRELGHGGMGSVWLAHDPALQRDVAIKVLRLGHGSNEPILSRILREARAAARLNHPNAVTVYHVLEQDGEVCIVMELIEGGSLADQIARTGPLAWSVATRAVRDAAAALSAAHAAGLVHRDIKPSNLMRTNQGAIKLVDFGIATPWVSDEELTGSPGIAGTPAYMAPERCRGAPADPRSDLYSLACTYFTLLTGREPYVSCEPSAMMYRHCHEPFPDVLEFLPDLPPVVCRIIRRGTQKEPRHRYGSADEMLADLTAALDQSEPGQLHAEAMPPVSAVHGRCSSSNLPVQLTRFIGREAETAEATALLERMRLLTLSGEGGTGKTRLGLHVAGTVMRRMGLDVSLVDLGTLKEPGMVVQKIATLVGQRGQPGQVTLDRLVEQLRSRQMLLVLDNCEHLIESCSQTAEALLAGCPGLRILITSREPLHIAGEIVLRVGPLSVPPLADTADLRRVSRYDAVILFVDRAGMAIPNFALSAANARVVAHICRSLDGLPLAIELAAARVGTMPIDQIAARLDDRFRLLTRGSRTAVPRHQTLEALIDWSHQLLSEPLRMVFRRLSVLSGEFGMEAVEAVCGSEFDRRDVPELVTHLVDKSLVSYREEHGKARYRLLESVRHYAAQRLLESGEVATVRTHHLEHYLCRTRQAGVKVGDLAQPDWIFRLGEEYDNLRSALEWVELGPSGAEVAARLAGTLYRLWWRYGMWDRGRAWIDTLMSLVPTASPATRARVLYGAAVLSQGQDDYERAMQLLEQSLELLRNCNDRRSIAGCLHTMGLVAWRQGEYSRCRTLLEQSLEIRYGLNDRTLVASSLADLGNILHETGEWNSGRTMMEEALKGFRAVQLASGIANALLFLGRAALREGEQSQAHIMLQESLGLFRELKFRLGAAYCLNDLGILARLTATLTPHGRCTARVWRCGASSATAAASPIVLKHWPSLPARRGSPSVRCCCSPPASRCADRSARRSHQRNRRSATA
jgi:predicted ATPase